MIRHHQMTPEQSAAVAKAMHEAATEDEWSVAGDDVCNLGIVPIQTGTLWHFDGATFAQFPDHNNEGDWFNLHDLPPNEAEGFGGGWLVFDDDGRPLGSFRGPLYLCLNRHSGRWFTHIGRKVLRIPHRRRCELAPMIEA